MGSAVLDPNVPPRRLLVLDSSYSLEAIKKKHLEPSVLCRDLEGYFDQVFTVHPFATLVTSSEWAPRHGRPVATRLAARHVFIEGKVGLWRGLARLPALNFLFAQTAVLWDLLKLVRRERISVVRAGDPLLLGLYGLLIARASRIPLLIRVGGNNEKVRTETGRPLMPKLVRFSWLERAIERFVLRQADMVAAANEDNLRYALSMGARPDRSTVFRYGNLIHPAHFTEPAARPDPRDLLTAIGLKAQPYLLYIGRLEPVKMADHVLQALAIIRNAGHSVSLAVVGSGSMEPALRSLASQLGVSDSVVFAGEREQGWLAQVIPHAAVVFSPHTGRALAEAALGGAAIVAYDIDWQKELIKTGESGCLVPLGDVAQMAAAGIDLLTDRIKAQRMGTRLRALALDMMDPEHLNEHERRTYDRLLIPPVATGVSDHGPR